MKNAVLVLYLPALATNLCKEGGEAVVVLLTPFFERMVMAASALDPQTQEKLRRVLELRRGILHFAIPADRWALSWRAGRGQNLAHKAIIRLIFIQALANPFVE